MLLDLKKNQANVATQNPYQIFELQSKYERSEKLRVQDHRGTAGIKKVRNILSIEQFTLAKRVYEPILTAKQYICFKR